MLLVRNGLAILELDKRFLGGKWQKKTTVILNAIE
jgi:hypothetical protein